MLDDLVDLAQRTTNVVLNRAENLFEDIEDAGVRAHGQNHCDTEDERGSQPFRATAPILGCAWSARLFCIWNAVQQRCFIRFAIILFHCTITS